MRRVGSARAALLVGLGALVLPATAQAAVGGEGGFKDFAWEVGNLALLLVVLVLAARKPVTAYLADRRRGIEQDMQSAAKLLSDAEARLAEWSDRADRLEEEVASIKASARKAAEDDREAILADARATAERIRRSAAGAVERELRLAKAELQREAAELAVQLAGGILREKVTDEDRERLFDEFVQTIEAEGAH